MTISIKSIEIVGYINPPVQGALNDFNLWQPIDLGPFTSTIASHGTNDSSTLDTERRSHRIERDLLRPTCVDGRDHQ